MYSKEIRILNHLERWSYLKQLYTDEFEWLTYDKHVFVESCILIFIVTCLRVKLRIEIQGVFCLLSLLVAEVWKLLLDIWNGMLACWNLKGRCGDHRVLNILVRCCIDDLECKYVELSVVLSKRRLRWSLGVEEMMLINWADVRIRNDPLNKLNNMLIKGLLIIYDEYPIKS